MEIAITALEKSCKSHRLSGLVLGSCLALALSSPALAQTAKPTPYMPGTYDIDPAHTRVSFVIGCPRPRSPFRFSPSIRV
ncbi:hypothetical protein [Oligoflexus tunisiensis]|uniref:hypothetical protein n=1 Tax=Oligoflexus tunisiensis TaxID=708132 RepID=UPI001C4047F0|nr:hypothetical protein [Oligoflexus tunisiensis]